MSCATPFSRLINGQRVLLPCGRCLKCRIDKRNEWTWRLSAELRYSDGVFVTLTIDEDNMLPSRSVYKASLQRFFKRLRKKLGDRKIKYYAVSEYGLQDMRPHYHCIIVGLSCGKPLTADLGDIPLIRSCWKYGFIKVEPACKSNIRYVLKYLDKEQDVKKWKRELPQLTPPFHIMSQGIGAYWICNEGRKLIGENEMFYYDNAFRPLPRYYKEKLGLIDKYRTDYKDVSVWQRLSKNPSQFKALMDKLKADGFTPSSGFFYALEEANQKLGEQELIDIQRKSDNGYRL